MGKVTAAEKGTSLVVAGEPKAAAGAKPLRNARHERYCQLRQLMRPKADAYRQAFDTEEGYKDHAANGNACKLERRPEVQDRINFLCRRDDDETRLLKARRLEEMLWTIHEVNVADMWEMVEVEKRDGKGNPVLDVEGKPVMKLVQRPKPIHEMSEETQRAVEAITINEAGFVIPKPYSKLQANVELRKLLGIGTLSRDDGDVGRLSDAELVAQLAQQAKELGIEIDLSYRF